MAYSVKADILKQITEDQLVGLTDDSDLGSVDDAIVTEMIARADEVIDGYCAKRYTVPFGTTPGIIKTISIDIAVYNLYSRRSHVMTEDRKNRYENSMKLLKDIESGKVSLGVPAPAENPDRLGSYDGNDRIFTRDDMEGF